MADLYGDLSSAAIVAEASGKKPNDDRWTTLSLYFFANEQLAVKHGAIGGQYVAEIVGETKRADEERRVRRGSFQSLAKALNWGAFNAKSTLYQELHRKALAWMEAQARDVAAGGTGSGLVPILSGGVAVDPPGGAVDIDKDWLELQVFIKPGPSRTHVREDELFRALGTAFGKDALFTNIYLGMARDDRHR